MKSKTKKTETQVSNLSDYNPREQVITTKEDPEKNFESLIEVYGTDDPEVIQQRILWRYIKAIFVKVSGYTPSPVTRLRLSLATVENLHHHDAQFTLCNTIIDLRKAKTIVTPLKKVLALVLIVLAFGCSKKEDPEPTRDQLLVNAKSGWIITAATIAPGIDYNGTAITDLYTQFDACDKDENLIFKSSGKYQEENPVKCDPTEPAIAESGTWTMTSDKSIINFKPDGDTAYEGKIGSLTTAGLTLSMDFDPGTGIKYKLTLTYKVK